MSFATDGPRVARFAEAYLRHTKGQWAGKPVVFEDWQRAFLDEAFRLDDDGQRVYSDITEGLARKNAKSTKAATVSLYLLGPDGEPGPEVYAGAGSGDQASIVFDQAGDFVDANPRLADWFRRLSTTIQCSATGGFLKRIAADGRLQHGKNPHGVVLDELHAFTTPKQEDFYEAMTTAGAAREEPMVLKISTAGDDPDTILGRIYGDLMDSPLTERVGGAERERLKAGLTVLRDPDTGRLVWWYGADEGADIESPEVWRACNPASWVSLDFLAQQFNNPNVPEVSFRKLHLNQFVKSRTAWIPWGTWPGLLAPVTIAGPIAIGVDVGLTSDTTAVVWCGAADDGSGRMVLRSRVWSARDDVPHDVFVPGGQVDLSLVREFIVSELAERHTIDHLRYDPRFFTDTAQQLSKAGLTVAEMSQSSAPMADAYQGFYQDARTGGLAHNGDPVLMQHVESTAAVRTERGWRVSKLKSNKRIDACVAACMALYGARRLGSEAPAKGWVKRR